MKSNVFIFHGTGGSPEENWFPWLKREVESKAIKVTIPQFPTPEEQSLEKWLKILHDYQDQITPDSILIGHSLGGAFLLRLLEKLEHKIKAAIFVATPIGVEPIKNYDADKLFLDGFTFNWPKIKDQTGTFIIYHSDNDPYVSLGNGQKLAKNLGINLTFIPNAGHFNKNAGYTAFPELLKQVEEILK